MKEIDETEYILNHLNASETLVDPEFLEWLKDEKHQILFEEIRNYREAFLCFEDKGNYRVEAEYGRFTRRIRSRKQIYRLGWVAACMAGIILGIIFMKPELPSGVKPLQKEIVAGKRGAELILANGERVLLEKQMVELQEENGVLVINDSSCQLTYHQEGSIGCEDNSGALVYHTLKVPSGADYMVSLSDGSRVWLNCGTEFRYPVTFAGKERRVFLDGEAFFEVEKSGDWPFIVETDKMDVRVTGTRFNVKSYAAEYVIHTTLVEGCVEVKAGDCPDTAFRLSPSQQFCLDKYTGQRDVRTVDVRLYTGWTEGMFVFKGQRLEEVMDMLARWYSVEVFYVDSSVKDLHFSGYLGRYEHIDTLLRMIEATDKIKIERKGEVVTLSGK